MKCYFLVIILLISCILKLQAQNLTFTKDTTNNIVLVGNSFTSDYSFTNDNLISTTIGGLTSTGKFINNHTLDIAGTSRFLSDGFNLGTITCGTNFESNGYFRNSLSSSIINASSIYFNGRLLNNGHLEASFLLYTYALVQNFNQISATSNNSTIYHFGSVSNAGLINSAHNISISGEFVNSANAKVKATDEIKTTSLISNIGTFSSSILTISGKFINSDSIIANTVIMTEGGYLESSGVILANKIIVENGASFINSGVLTVDSLKTYGSFENSSSSTNVNHTIIHSGTINNSLTIPISGSLAITGSVENHGTLDVYGSLSVSELSSLKNIGSINNFGSLHLSGTLLNENTFVNKTNSQLMLLDAAKFDNKLGSIFSVESGAQIVQENYSLLIFRE